MTQLYLPGMWRPMKDAPTNSQLVHLLCIPNRNLGPWAEQTTVVRDAHYACDMSGEEQPPFKGYFLPVVDTKGRVLYYSQVSGKPIGWMPAQETPL